MLLLDIIGFTAIRDTFYVAFAFLRDKKQPTYEVALLFLLEIYTKIKAKRNRDPSSYGNPNSPSSLFDRLGSSYRLT
jgi:hypothetical protein